MSVNGMKTEVYKWDGNFIIQTENELRKEALLDACSYVCVSLFGCAEPTLYFCQTFNLYDTGMGIKIYKKWVASKT
jgi:hypothetical protein